MFGSVKLMEQQAAAKEAAPPEAPQAAPAAESNAEVQEQLEAEGVAPEEGTPVLDQVGAGQGIPKVPVPGRPSPLTTTMPPTSTNGPFMRQAPSQIKVLELGGDEDRD